MIKRRLSIFLTALAVLLVFGAVAPLPAHAAYDGCPFGYVCGWTSTGGEGTRYSYHGVSGFCTNITDGGNNTLDSFYNRREDGRHVQFYDGLNCSGALLCKHAGYWYCPGSAQGPHPAGTAANFIDIVRRGGHRTNHRNHASSIWFNNG